jgi:flavin reductase (DIM6/NTAB) family NADH-FMN oxidoreductase RutF
LALQAHGGLERWGELQSLDVRVSLTGGLYRPIVLVVSAWKVKTNIMTMGWHIRMQFTPALFGCYIWDGNHSFEIIRKI